MKDYSNYHTSPNTKILSDAEIIFNSQLESLDGKNVLIDGLQTRVILHNHTNPLDEYKEDRKLMCLNSVIINRGSTVFLEDENYLVLTDIDTNSIYKTCKIRKTNTTVKFYNYLNQQVEYKCIAKNETMYTLGTEQGSFVTVGNAKLSIVFPLNEDTDKITRDMIFIVDKSGWEVTNIDKLNRGIVKLLCGETTSVSKNEIENGIMEVKSVITNENQSSTNVPNTTISNLPNANKPKLL